MHQARLSTAWLEEQRARRGLAGFALAAPETALLVIDMQDVFTEPGAPLEVPAARGIVDNINRLAGALRPVGGKVVWVYTTLAEAGSARDWIYLTDFVGPERRESIRSALRPGQAGHALWPGLDVRNEDMRCEKDRFSPFSPGASSLDSILREAGISHLLIAGTLTNVCCECTARDAMMLNYRVTVVEDANAARTDDDHLRGLTTVAQLFADIRTTRDVVGALQRNDE
ncbi:MAG: isochorismatase family cysteine hydrolase [Pseudomonadota bacterium]|nr:isochorismatase family cysteine hydrolase [Pseudomonadota bacterium]